MQINIYISKEHQKVVAEERDDEISIETRLTKWDKISAGAEDADESDFSDLTGETRESKAKPYAVETTKQVAAQYIGTITELNLQIKTSNDRFGVLGKHLESTMRALAMAADKSSSK